MSKPDQRRPLRYDDWDDVIADVDALLANGYTRVGKHSLGQNCNHLATLMECALDGFPWSFPRPAQWMMRKLFLPGMMRHEPITLRVPAPAFARQRAPVDDAVGVTRLKAVIERFRRPDATYVPHLVFGMMSPDEYKHQQLWHAEHHLSFLLPNAP